MRVPTSHPRKTSSDKCVQTRARERGFVGIAWPDAPHTHSLVKEWCYMMENGWSCVATPPAAAVVVAPQPIFRRARPIVGHPVFARYMGARAQRHAADDDGIEHQARMEISKWIRRLCIAAYNPHISNTRTHQSEMVLNGNFGDKRRAICGGASVYMRENTRTMAINHRDKFNYQDVAIPSR